MSALTKILTGAAGLAAAVGFASPAAAQYYPSYPGNQSVVGAIINSVIGANQYGYGQYGQYGQYGYGQGNERFAVDQCSRAVEARISGSYNRGYNYGAYTQGYGYNQAYGGRVTGITRVERRSNGLRVRGVASSGAAYAGYGGYGGYNAGADLSFNCKVDYRGRITDLDIDRRSGAYYRGY